MNLLISSSLDPYWNLATEEYLLKNSFEDYLFLYVNKPCVVVGKHQIAQKEVNAPFVLANNILVPEDYLEEEQFTMIRAI